LKNRIYLLPLIRIFRQIQEPYNQTAPKPFLQLYLIYKLLIILYWLAVRHKGPLYQPKAANLKFSKVTNNFIIFGWLLAGVMAPGDGRTTIYQLYLIITNEKISKIILYNYRKILTFV